MLRLRSLENGERGGGTTEMQQATATGRDMLVVADARAKKGAELVIAAYASWPPHLANRLGNRVVSSVFG